MAEHSRIKESRLKIKDARDNLWRSYRVVVEGSILSLREEYDREKILEEIDLKDAKIGPGDSNDPSHPSFSVRFPSGETKFFSSASHFLQELWVITVTLICNTYVSSSSSSVVKSVVETESERGAHDEEVKSNNVVSEEKKENVESNEVRETVKKVESKEKQTPLLVVSASQKEKLKEENGKDEPKVMKQSNSRASLPASKSVSKSPSSLSPNNVNNADARSPSRKSSGVFDKGLKSSEAPLVYWDKLLPGETVRFYRNIIRIGTKGQKEMEPVEGTLYVTNFRLCFLDSKKNLENKISICIPLTTIKEVRKLKKSKVQVSTIVNFKAFEIVCKDLRWMRLVYGKNQQVNANIIQDIIEAIPKNQQQVFAFELTSIPGPLLENFKGWEVYDPIQDYTRLGIPDFKWRISTVNQDLKMSPAYPPLLVVPNRVTDEDLLKISEFRSRGRIPACVWKHAKNETVLLRCSQPGSGIRRARCPEDEQLLMAVTTETPLHELVGSASAEKRKQSRADLPIEEESSKSERATRLRSESKSISFRKSTHKSVTLTPLGGKLLYISDSRPKVNAQFNILKGFGWESPDYYKNTILEFWNIDNIHVMRDSLKKLGKACRGTLNEVDVEKSGWLDHLRKVLTCSVRLAELLHEEDTSVLAHCTDGWDRTAQNVALTELLLDPYYRTIFGFASLIEKEFLSFGHQMALRNGHGDKIYAPKDSERSPIFLQFIDCVFQIVFQTPEEFQFDSKLLIAIIDNSFSCLYGTFLCDNEAERESLKLKEETVSFWDFVARNFSFFVNPTYKAPSSNIYPIPIYEKFHPNRVCLWREYYLRWVNGSSGAEYFPYNLDMSS